MIRDPHLYTLAGLALGWLACSFFHRSLEKKHERRTAARSPRLWQRVSAFLRGLARRQEPVDEPQTGSDPYLPPEARVRFQAHGLRGQD